MSERSKMRSEASLRTSETGSIPRPRQAIWVERLAARTISLRSFPLALFGVCLLAFGLLIPWLGLHQDDWVVVWFWRTFGSGVFVDFFAAERPFLAGVYMLTTALVGDSVLGWHIFALLCRWLLALSAWWTLRVLWPGRALQAAWVALLFAVYPSFREQSLAVVYSQNYILFAAGIFSLGAMVQAVRQPARRALWTTAALLAQAFCHFSIEYFFGLELLRPVILWLAIRAGRQDTWKRLRAVILFWLPYLGVLALFLVWRVFIFSFVTYEPKLIQELTEDPRTALIGLVQTIQQDALDVTIYAWTQTLDFVKTIEPGLLGAFLPWVVILFAAVMVTIYLLKLKDWPAPAEDRREGAGWAAQAMGIGVLSLLTMGWPYWFTGLPVGLQISDDRFTLAFTFGASLLIVGVIEWLVKTHAQKAILLGVLAGLAIGLQVRTADVFRGVYAGQAEFFRQLAWRAPGLEPGTLLLSNPLPLRYTGANSLQAPLNWIYAERQGPEQLNYTLLFIPEKLGNSLPELAPGYPVEQSLRTLDFSGTTSQALVLYYEPPGCLQVIDPGIDYLLPRLPDYIGQAAAISNTGLILPEETYAARQVAQIFGAEVDAGWCAYYQQADLARQSGDWAGVAALGDRAFEKGLAPAFKYEMEYLPFIEGYAHTGSWEQALSLTNQAVGAVPALQPALCAVWDRIQEGAPPGPGRSETIALARERLSCSHVEGS